MNKKVKAEIEKIADENNGNVNIQQVKQLAYTKGTAINQAINWDTDTLDFYIETKCKEFIREYKKEILVLKGTITIRAQVRDWISIGPNDYKATNKLTPQEIQIEIQKMTQRLIEARDKILGFCQEKQIEPEPIFEEANLKITQ